MAGGDIFGLETEDAFSRDYMGSASGWAPDSVPRYLHTLGLAVPNGSTGVLFSWHTCSIPCVLLHTRGNDMELSVFRRRVGIRYAVGC